MGSGTGTPVSQGTPAAPQSAPATAVPDTTFDAFNPPAPPGPVFDAFNPPPPDTTFDAFNPPGGRVVREGLSFQERLARETLYHGIRFLMHQIFEVDSLQIIPLDR